MTVNKRIRLFFIVAPIFILVLVALALINQLYIRKLERALADSDPIERIQIRIAMGNDSSGLRNVTITDSNKLLEINRLLQHENQAVSIEVRNNTGMAECYFFKKNKKFEFSAIKTVKNGWVFAIGSNKYKNDSLIHVMIYPYL